jgi:triacylglycerol lipase
VPNTKRMLLHAVVLLCTAGAAPLHAAEVAEGVVLLHGLARSASSMNKLARALQADGYRVCNVDYPSRQHDIATLTDYVALEIVKCFPERAPVHFVTHSMGGVLVRQLAIAHSEIPIARVVMLAPPNGGSEVVDKLGDWRIFKAINGPAGGQLGTDPQATLTQLGSPSFELGVIAGNSTVNPLLSSMIPGDDDGKVSVARTKLDGMRDFVLLASSHPFIMTNAQAIAQTKYFLRHGGFRHAAVTQP